METLLTSVNPCVNTFFKSLFFTLVLCISSITGSGQLYWNGTGAWGAANTWGVSSGGPYNLSWTPNSVAVFEVAGSTITGATIACSGITATEDVTVSPSGTFGTGGTVITVDVAPGKTFDFSSQGVSSVAGTGFIKSNAGVFALSGGSYSGGFTLNAGTVVVRGVNAFGSGGILNINSGTICSNANRNLSGKPTVINIGGNFTLGATTGLASATATLTFDAPITLGSGQTRTITIGNTAAHTFNGVISGTGSGITVNTTSTGRLVLGGANTYDGLTTISGGTLQLNKTGGGTLPNTNDVVINSSGLLQVSSSQTLHNLTLSSSSTLTVDAGVTLTIGGTLFHNGGNIILGTGASIVYSAGATLAYGASTVQLTSDKEFSATSGLSNLTINNPAGVILHTSREIFGALNFSSGNITLGINDLTIASASGFSATQHAVTDNTGKLIIKNIGAAAAIFPIGANSTTINPLSISNGNNSDYAARVETGFPFPILAGNNAVNRTWTVTASTTPGAGVNVTFFYSTGDGNPGFNYTGSVEHGVYTAGWNINQSGLSPTGSYQVATVVSSFVAGAGLPMVIGNMGAILSNQRSVDLSVLKRNEGALLNWTVNISTALKDISIERSADGRKFEALVKLPVISSSYTDDKLPAGMNYYRIKITDINGKIMYSAVVACINSDSGFDIISLLPNIVSTEMQLNVSAAKKTKMYVLVTDISGRPLIKSFYKLAAGSSLLDINVTALAAGMYYLTATTEEGAVKTVRFAKQ